MMSEKAKSSRLNSRNFLRIAAVAGGAGVCWQLGLFGSSRQLHVVRRSGQLMGTIVNLTVYSHDPDQAEHAVTETLSVMKKLERSLSRHMADSELSFLNQTGSLNNPSEELHEVLTLSQMLSHKSGGAFDVSVLPLLKLHENSGAVLPDEAARQNAKNLIGYDAIRLSPEQITFDKPGMQITFDGVGKGFIVDRGVATLQRLGFANVCVEAGGDLMVTGRKTKDKPWHIGLRDPRGARKMVTLDVSDRAVATSGDYLQAFSSDLRHHHILDPHSGYSPPLLTDWQRR